MISKRYRRSSQPQENLKQFSLNTSKGIDGTKPITDPDTVLDMENLTINYDGSLSIRKPMLAKHPSGGGTYIKTHLMYDSKHFIGVRADGGFNIVNRESGKVQPVVVKSRNYYTHAEKTWSYFNYNIFKVSEATFVNASNTTIVGNCFVQASDLWSAGALDNELYDSLNVDLPRYLQISYSEEDSAWQVYIINPELTQLTTAEGEIPLNPNMCLDNPYAIRDGYGYAVPFVKGVIPYILQNASEVPSSETTVRTLEASSKNIPRIPESSDDVEYFKHYLKYTTNVAQPWGEFLKIIPYPGASITLKAYLDEVDGVDQGKVTATFTNFVGTLKILLDVYPIDKATGEIISSYVGGHWLTFTESSTLDVNLHSLETYSQAYHYHVVRWNYALSWNVSDMSENIANLKVSQITESCVSDATYRPCSVLKFGTPLDWIVLKAFCNLPDANGVYYVTWDYSFDGVRWNPRGAHAFTEFPGSVFVNVLDEMWAPSEDVKTPSETDYVTRTYVPLRSFAADDRVASSTTSRPDVLPLYLFKSELGNYFPNSVVFRCSIATLKKDDAADSLDIYEIVSTVSQYQFTLTPAVETAFLETDLPNAVLGEKMYYKKSIYSYGTEDFKSFVYSTDVGSFITPLYNVIDVDTYSEDVVTSVVPWRDYLFITTERAAYLSTKATSGYLTKIVSANVGVPFNDRACVVPTLNGIIFKRDDAVYLAYPNLYASDSSTLILTDISRQIEHVLEGIGCEGHSFAILYDDMYVLMLPQADSTRCLIYDISLKCWSNYSYPTAFRKFYEDSENGVTAVSETFECTLFEDATAEQASLGHFDRVDLAGTTAPIHFYLDTGQKTDSILHTKQFVESKLMFATLSEQDAFPFTLYVAVDGDPHVTRMDVSTDAPFWKTADTADPSRGVLGTAFRLGGADTPATGAFNTLRQLIVRYSGKGKSVRHVIEGESLYNFKLYETYVRYKNLNVKQ